MKSDYLRDGHYLVRHLFDSKQVAGILEQLSQFEEQANNYGVRDLMTKIPYIRQLALSAPLIDIAREILGDTARPVRSVFFDKVPGANWNVAWHQDTSIALEAQHEVDGFGPWSVKQGVVHAEPPVEYLQNTLTLRLHLDAANAESGVLRVVSGSHLNGRIHASEILRIVDSAEVVECDAEAGDLLLMNPLLFHSSRKATWPTHRRIVHIEYSSMALPPPLAWHECA